MKCPCCLQGITKSDHIEIELERDGIMKIVKEIPTEVCDTCGGVFYLRRDGGVNF